MNSSGLKTWHHGFWTCLRLMRWSVIYLENNTNFILHLEMAWICPTCLWDSWCWLMQLFFSFYYLGVKGSLWVYFRLRNQSSMWFRSVLVSWDYLIIFKQQNTNFAISMSFLQNWLHATLLSQTCIVFWEFSFFFSCNSHASFLLFFLTGR